MNDLPASRSRSPDGAGAVTAWLALFLFMVFLRLYVVMAAPGLDWGDAGEAQLAAWTAGLSHPTGYPLFLMLGWFWTHALAMVGMAPTRAMTLLSSAAGAATVAVTVPMMMALLNRSALLGYRLRLIVAVTTAVFVGLSPTFASQALLAEVYTLHALFLVLLLWGLWAQGALSTRIGWLALLYGFALGHHRTMILWMPALLLWLWYERNRVVPGGRVGLRWIARLVGLVVLPQLLYLYIVWRGPQTPYLHQSLTTGQQFNLYDGSARAFLDHILGIVFAADLGLRESMSGRLNGLWALARANVASGLLLPLAVWGILAPPGRGGLLRADGLLLATGTVATLLFGLFYAIGDVEVMFIPAWLGIAFLAFGTWGVIWGIFQRSGAGRWLTLFCGLLLLVPLLLQAPHFPPSRAALTAPRSFVDAVLAASPPPDAILISNDRDEMVPLFYAQFAERQRTDMLALFPLITPASEHRTLGSLVEWALQWERPVLLVKPMPGLGMRFELEPYAAPLVEVKGPVPLPAGAVEQGALSPELSVTAWDIAEEQVAAGGTVTASIALVAMVRQDRDLSFSLQVFDETGERIAQRDVAPDPYFPSSQWPTGEPLRLEIPVELLELETGTMLAWRLTAYHLQLDSFETVGQQVVLGHVRVEE